MTKLNESYWNKFLTEAVSITGPTNFIYDFNVLTKKYGKAYREFIKTAYQVKDDLTDEAFCELNRLPEHFLTKFLQ